jgi:hypothetical protein
MKAYLQERHQWYPHQNHPTEAPASTPEIRTQPITSRRPTISEVSHQRSRSEAMSILQNPRRRHLPHSTMRQQHGPHRSGKSTPQDSSLRLPPKSPRSRRMSRKTPTTSTPISDTGSIKLPTKSPRHTGQGSQGTDMHRIVGSSNEELPFTTVVPSDLLSESAEP